MNSLYQQLNQNAPLSNNFKQMFQMFRSAKNPQAFMQNMMQNNPQVKQAMDYVNQNGGDPKTAFYNLAKQKGVNPDDILNQLK